MIARRFAGARAREVLRALQLEVPFGDAWYRARVELGPETRVSVSLPCTDGFELALRWADRWVSDGEPRAATFDDSFLVETNDLALAHVWLDHEAREALLASRYVAASHGERATALLLRDGAWVHEVANDEVCARRRAIEPSLDRVGDMLLASLLLASRPVRWARVFGALARATGGHAAARIEVGGRPALRVRRGMVDVTVRVARRLGPGDPGRLRTIVGAHRHASAGETLSLIAEGLPRAAWPPRPEAPAGGRALPIDARAAALLEAARPSATTVRGHDVEIAFDGALTDRERVGAAIELAAWWAASAGRGAPGPYR